MHIYTFKGKGLCVASFIWMTLKLLKKFENKFYQPTDCQHTILPTDQPTDHLMNPETSMSLKILNTQCT